WSVLCREARRGATLCLCISAACVLPDVQLSAPRSQPNEMDRDTGPANQHERAGDGPPERPADNLQTDSASTPDTAIADAGQAESMARPNGAVGGAAGGGGEAGSTQSNSTAGSSGAVAGAGESGGRGGA